MRTNRPFLISIVLTLTCGVTDALAQSAARRMEVAGAASVHHLTRSNNTTTGVTGRFSFDVTNWLAAEAEVTFFPSDDITIRTQLPDVDFGLIYNRRRTDALFGVKIGHRFDRYGLFAKVRPGLTHLSNQGLGCAGDDCARILMLSLPAPTSYRTEFALDLGGGFEFFPSRNTVTRIEFGDMIIRHRSFAPPCWQETCSSHNFTTRIGGGVRF